MLLLSLINCNGQNKKIEISKKNKTKVNKPSETNSMKYFILDKYKDWELDTDFLSSDNHKFYKKDDRRVEITMYDDAITIRQKNKNKPYVFIESFYPNNNIKYSGNDFYTIHTGIWKEFDSTGRLIKEKKYDEFYKFTIENLIEKINKDYNFDLEDVSQGGSVGRNGKDGISYYEVSLKSKEEPLKMDYILVDGTTGKTLFKSYYYMKGGGKNPFDEYLETLKNK